MSIEIYQELKVIKESDNKRIYLVQSALDGLYYIKRVLRQYDYHIYEILKSIHHPHLPEIIEIKEENETLIVIEEYINAPTLESYIVNDEISYLEAIEIMKQLCKTLEVLHNYQIIHRDIKPENIFYDKQNITLFDFDIARVYQPLQSKDTIVLGSVGYAAPEQFGFKQSDARTDIYALGVLFNVLLTNHLPNEGLFSGKGEYIIQKATQLDPIKRYQTALEMQEDIIEHMGKSSWALPGFRSGDIKSKIWASIGYFLFVLVMVMSEFEGVPRWSLEEWGNKLVIFGFVSIIIVFCTNYKNIYRCALFHRSHNQYLRVGGIILSTIVAEFIYILLCSIVQIFIK